MQKPGWWTRRERATSLMASRCLLMAPMPKRPLGWMEGLGQNPFPMGWDGEHDVRGTGEDERPQGVGLLHRAGRTRSGSSPGDQRRPGPLTSSAVTPAVKVGCTSWTRGPGEMGSWAEHSTCTVWRPLSLDSAYFWGPCVLDEQGCGGAQGLPGLCPRAGNLAVSAGYRRFLPCPPPSRLSGFGDVSCMIWVSSQR